MSTATPFVNTPLKARHRLWRALLLVLLMHFLRTSYVPLLVSRASLLLRFVGEPAN
jgi:hypothetical protein